MFLIMISDYVVPNGENCQNAGLLLRKCKNLEFNMFDFIQCSKVHDNVMTWKCFPHHDDVIKWKHFPRYWQFVRGIHRSPVNYPHKGQWRRDLVFSLICVWINGWVNSREVGDLRRYRAHYDVAVMITGLFAGLGLGLGLGWGWGLYTHSHHSSSLHKEPMIQWCGTLMRFCCQPEQSLEKNVRVDDDLTLLWWTYGK